MGICPVIFHKFRRLLYPVFGICNLTLVYRNDRVVDGVCADTVLFGDTCILHKLCKHKSSVNGICCNGLVAVDVDGVKPAVFLEYTGNECASVGEADSYRTKTIGTVVVTCDGIDIVAFCGFKVSSGKFCCDLDRNNVFIRVIVSSNVNRIAVKYSHDKTIVSLRRYSDV